MQDNLPRLPELTSSSLEDKVSKVSLKEKLNSVKDFMKSDDGKAISILSGIPFVGGAITGYIHSKGVLSEIDPSRMGLMAGVVSGVPYAFFIACNKEQADSIGDICLGSGTIGAIAGIVGALGYGTGYSIGKYLF